MITLLRTPKLAQKWIHRHTARFTKVYFQSAVEQSEDNQLQKYIKNVPHLQFGSNLTSILQNKLFSYSISSILLSQDYTPSPTAILGIIFDFCNCFLKELQHYHDEIECSNSPTNSAALIEDFEACLDTVSSHLQSKGGVLLHLNLAFLSIMKCRICYKTSFPCSSKKIQDYIGNVEDKLQIVLEECHSFDKKDCHSCSSGFCLIFQGILFPQRERRLFSQKILRGRPTQQRCYQMYGDSWSAFNKWWNRNTEKVSDILVCDQK